MAAKKKTSTKKTTKSSSKSQKNTTGKLNRQATAILLFATAIFILCVSIIPGESVWNWLHIGFRGLFGLCVFLLPVVIGYIAVMISKEKEMGPSKVKVIEGIVLICLLGGGLQIFLADIDGSFFDGVANGFLNGAGLRGGGALGAILGYPLEWGAGDVGAKIIIGILIFVFLMLVTGSTLIGFFKTLGKPVQKTHETIKNVVNDTFTETEEEDEPKEKPVPYPFERRGRSRSRIDIDLGEGYADDPKPAKTRTPRKPSGVAGTEAEEAPPIDITKEIAQFANEAAENDKKRAEEKEASTTAKSKEDKAEHEEFVYRYPPLSLLDEPNPSQAGNASAEMQSTAERLVQTLRDYGVETSVVGISRGASVTRYELEPKAGVRVKKIADLADDIALRLAAGSVRIEAPIPNKAAVGIEVPNQGRAMITLRELLETKDFQTAKSKLTVCLGKNIDGRLITADLAKMPHLLVAGTTGSGKSVCTNSMILSILFRATPEEVRMVLIDPKQVEFSVYNKIPHLLVPVVTDPRKAAGALGWSVTEMLRRYQLFSANSVRDFESYNKIAKKDDNDLEVIPQLLIVIDEFADLMMSAANEVEEAVCRIAQMGRAAGIHMVIATQRPSVDVCTGLIKSNIPSRLSLTTSSAVDSRTILDMTGAEKLLGNGDLLFLPVGSSKPMRVQGCYVSDDERNAVVEFLKNQKEEQSYDESIIDEINRQASAAGGKGSSSAAVDAGDGGDECDELLSKALEIAIEAGEVSTSMLQRKLRVGYARAGRLVDEMEQKGYVGPHAGSKPREVLISKQQWLEMNMMTDDDLPGGESTGEFDE